jgi:hypothetical protein
MTATFAYTLFLASIYVGRKAVLSLKAQTA